MPGNAGKIQYAVLVDAASGKAEIKRVGDGFEDAGKRGKAAFLGVHSAMLKVGAAVVGILGVRAAIRSVTSAARDWIGVADVQESAEMRLAAVLESTGHAAGYTIGQLRQMAGEMQAVSTVGDEVTLSGMSILATFKNIKGDQFEEASKAALDMATVMGRGKVEAGTLNSTMVQLGKALNDPIAGISALARVGVTFTEQQKNQIKTLVESGNAVAAQNLILEELKSQFGGAAEAAAQTFGGGLAQAENALGDVKEELGFTITKSKFFIDLTHLARDALIAFGERIKENRGYLQSLAERGVLGVARALGSAVEVMRFFHNGWLGIKLAGQTAFYALAIGIEQTIRGLRIMLTPLNLLFEGLVKLGAIDVNPFDRMEAAAVRFKAVTADASAGVVEEIQAVNDKYDAVADAVSGAIDKIEALAKASDDAGGAGAAAAEKHRKAQEKLTEEVRDTVDALKGVDAELDDFFGEIDQARDKLSAAAKQTLKEQQKLAKDAVSETERAYEKMANNVQDLTRDVFRDILHGRMRDFEDFSDRMKDYFLDTLADMAAAAATKQIMLNVGTNYLGGAAGAAGVGGLSGGGDAGTMAGAGAITGSSVLTGAGLFLGGYSLLSAVVGEENANEYVKWGAPIASVTTSNAGSWVKEHTVAGKANNWLDDHLGFSFAQGGVIGERVVGVGVSSGKSYTFHGDQDGGEVVVPGGKMPAGEVHYHFHNNGVVTTGDVDAWMAERFRRLREFRVGDRPAIEDLSTAGIA